MGGKAFSQILPNGSFPRMSPHTYQILKARVTSQLLRLFEQVETPVEAPEKADYGDLDVLVCRPLGDITPEHVKQAIGAMFVVPMEGNRTSNYALPSERAGEFYQVDVHVCNDEGEWERIMFFNGYGDLGMILGLLARSCGLSLSTKGLKVRNINDHTA